MDLLYEWIQNLVCYLVIFTAVLEVLPGKEYKKYIQFFAGLVLILLLVTPILKVTGMEQNFGRYIIIESMSRRKESCWKKIIILKI